MFSVGWQAQHSTTSEKKKSLVLVFSLLFLDKMQRGQCTNQNNEITTKKNGVTTLSLSLCLKTNMLIHNEYTSTHTDMFLSILEEKLQIV